MSADKKIRLVFGIGILVIIFTPVFGNFYEKLFGPLDGGGFFGVSDHPEYYPGFFLSYSLFVSLFLILFGEKKKYKNIGIAVGLILLFLAVLGAYEDLLLNIGAAAIGFLLAQLVLLIKRGVGKNIA